MNYEELFKSFVAAYEGDESGDGDSAAVAEVESGTSGDSEIKDDPKKTFSQKELNEIIAKERKKFQERDQGRLKELETLRQTFKGTKEEKERLDTQIEQLRMDMMSAEDRAKAEKENLRKQAESEKKVLEEDRDLWKGRYTEETIARAITDAAGSEKAISADPILAMLRSKTRLVPKIDKESGKETGELTVKTRMSVTNDKGELVDLDLSPLDAVRKMKEDNRYGYLFGGDKAAGLGGSQVSTSQDLTESLKTMDAKTYREKGRQAALRK